MVRSHASMLACATALLMAWFSPPLTGAEQTDSVPTDPEWNAEERWFGHGDLLRKARSLEERAKYAAAAKLYRRMAGMATRAEARTFARTKAADCFFRGEKYPSALEAYGAALGEAARHLRYEHILEQLRKLADQFEEGAGRWFGSNLSSAIDTMELILETAPLNSRAPADQLRLAHLYRRNNDQEQAAAQYRILIRQFPGRKQAQEARFHLASMLLRRARYGDKDGSRHEEAKRLLREYLDNASEGAAYRKKAGTLMERIHEFEARQILDKARFYTWKPHRNPEAARRHLSKLEQTPYSDTAAAAQATEIEQLLETGSSGGEGTVATASSTRENGGDNVLKKWLLPIDRSGGESVE